MNEILVKSEANIFDPKSINFDERSIQLNEKEKLEKEQQKREKQSPFKKWYQINKEHTKELIWLAGKHPKAYAVLLFLLDQMDSYNAVMCSSQVFQEIIGVSRQTVSKAISILKEKGYIAVLKSGSANVYVVNKEIAWNSWGSNTKYCRFPANVILSATENEEYIQKIEKTKVKQLLIKEK